MSMIQGQQPLATGLTRTQTTGTQAMVQMQPRDIREVERRVKEEAAMLGEAALYAWGSGKDRIEGPSWELAKSIMRQYGNCSLDMDPVQDLADAWVFTARSVDHETGFSISRQFRQSKRWTVHGKHDEARKEDVRFQIGQSKALRNVAMSFLPGWLVTRALDEAKGGVRAAIEATINSMGLEKTVGILIDKRAKGIGLDENRLLTAMGRDNRHQLTIDDLVIVASGIKAIESGADTLDIVFPVPEKPAAAGEATDGLLGRVMKTAKGEPAATPQPTPQVVAESPAASQDATQASPAAAAVTEVPFGEPAPQTGGKGKGDASAEPTDADLSASQPAAVSKSGPRVNRPSMK